MMSFYLTLLYNAAEVLTIDKRTTVCDVKKMLEPLMKLSSNQFKVGILICAFQKCYKEDN